MLQAGQFSGSTAIIIGTGPSLDVEAVKAVQERGCKLFGVNNTFEDFTLDVWLACDPCWHDIYSPVDIAADCWHWDEGIAEKYGYQYIEGRWGDGLSIDQNYIRYGHCSAYQLLNLAVHYGCNPILLAGHNMRDSTPIRYHGDKYPTSRQKKVSSYKGLLDCYQTIAEQTGLPTIINCTPETDLVCFPQMGLSEAVGKYATAH